MKKIKHYKIELITYKQEDKRFLFIIFVFFQYQFLQVLLVLKWEKF
jgi:hypothetical protein